MPNCFTLTRHGEKEPTLLTEIDEEICRHFGVEPHPKWWYYGWYDSIGFALATGMTLPEVSRRCVQTAAERAAKDDFESVNHLLHTRKIAKYLEANFTTDAWAEIGRR